MFILNENVELIKKLKLKIIELEDEINKLKFEIDKLCY